MGDCETVKSQLPTIIALLIAGLAFGWTLFGSRASQEDIKHLSERILTKASKETVEALQRDLDFRWAVVSGQLADIKRTLSEIKKKEEGR